MPAPVLGELAQHPELVVAEVGVGEHDDGEQLEGGHVLTVGRGVHGDALVELAEPLLHRAHRSQGRAAAGNDRRRKSSWCSSRFSATTSCGVMWVMPTRGSTSCGAPAARRADDSCKRVGGDDVVVGEAVDEQQRTGQPVGQRQQRAGVVHVGLLVRIAEVPLGVVRVVQPPLGDRSAGDGGVEDVGPAQHGERRQVAAEAPPADGDPAEVEHAVLLGGRLQRLDLVVEDGRGEVEVHGPLPRRPAARRAPPVGDDDGEALVGEPLRRQVGVVGLHGAQRVRPAVRVEQDGERCAVVVAGEQHGRRQPALATERQPGARSAGAAAWRSDVSSVPSSVAHCTRGSRSVVVRMTTVPPPAATACTPGSSVSGSSSPSTSPPHVEHGGVVDRVGEEHDARPVDRRDGAHLQLGRGDRRAVDEQSAGAVAVGARDELAVSGPRRGTPGTSSTQASSTSRAALGGVARRRVDVEHGDRRSGPAAARR